MVRLNALWYVTRGMGKIEISLETDQSIAKHEEI
jgi:hypothetical protein